jgi:hypothetical protein
MQNQCVNRPMASDSAVGAFPVGRRRLNGAPGSLAPDRRVGGWFAYKGRPAARPAAPPKPAEPKAPAPAPKDLPTPDAPKPPEPTKQAGAN